MIAEKSNVETALITKDDVAAGLINAIFADGADFVVPDDLRNAPLTPRTSRPASCANCGGTWRNFL